MKHLMKVTMNRCVYKIFWLTTLMIIKDNEYILVDNYGDNKSFKLSIDAIDVIMCHICIMYVYYILLCLAMYIWYYTCVYMCANICAIYMCAISTIVVLYICY